MKYVICKKDEIKEQLKTIEQLEIALRSSQSENKKLKESLEKNDCELKEELKTTDEKIKKLTSTLNKTTDKLKRIGYGYDTINEDIRDMNRDLRSINKWVGAISKELKYLDDTIADKVLNLLNIIKLSNDKIERNTLKILNDTNNTCKWKGSKS